MEKYRAIPQGYMTVGEVAKKMNTTVRTLQYYDREGLLVPSAESEGGRRLYTDKDIFTLHQIQSMKYLGFSLDDIKNRLICLDTPADVAKALTEQAEATREKITALSQSLEATLKLKAEVTQMDAINWKKYADIVVNLQINNEFYRIIKHIDDDTLDGMRGRFNIESAAAAMEAYTQLCNTAIQYQKDGVSPISEKGQNFAKEFWDLMTEITGGDMNLLSQLIEFAESADVMSNELKQKQEKAQVFLEPALGAYFTALSINPFEQAAGNQTKSSGGANQGGRI